MKVSTREVMQKKADTDYRIAIVMRYISHLEEAEQALEQKSSGDNMEIYRNIGKALGIVKYVKDGLRNYFSE